MKRARLGAIIFLMSFAPLSSVGQNETDTSTLQKAPVRVRPALKYLPADDELEEIEELDKEPLPMIQTKKETINPTPKQRSRFIEHPNAEKGLIKIDKDKVYHYKVVPSKKSKASSVRFGNYEPINLVSPDQSDIGYEDIYDQENWPLITYDQEHPFTYKYGRIGWKWGTGLFVARGTGQFETPQAEEPKEEFTLFVFPLNIGLIYHAQFWETQFIVPYAEAAAGGFAFAEMRDDDKNPSLGAALGFAPMAHFSLGGSIQMGRGARSYLDLDREYGINSFWIDVEYRNFIALGGPDFSGDSIAVGFTAEY